MPQLNCLHSNASMNKQALPAAVHHQRVSRPQVLLCCGCRRWQTLGLQHRRACASSSDAQVHESDRRHSMPACARPRPIAAQASTSEAAISKLGPRAAAEWADWHGLRLLQTWLSDAVVIHPCLDHISGLRISHAGLSDKARLSSQQSQCVKHTIHPCWLPFNLISRQAVLYTA